MIFLHFTRWVACSALPGDCAGPAWLAVRLRPLHVHGEDGGEPGGGPGAGQPGPAAAPQPHGRGQVPGQAHRVRRY